MELIRGLHNLRARHRGCVATIGAFDGVHYGHRAVLSQLQEKGRELGLPTTILVLEPLPREYFAPKIAPARISNFRERYELLEAIGIDRCLRVRFDQGLSEVPAEDFIKNVFVDGLGIKYMVVGDDLRFGHERQGDFNLLGKLGEQYDFQVARSNTLEIEGARASSTRLRKTLEDSDFALAERLLGRPYSMKGKVVYGQQLGRTLGFPTANIQLRRFRAALSGVYAVEVEGIADKPLPAVANIGTRPTVDDSIKAILEVHLLDFNQNIYGKRINVIFRKKLRDEQKFDGLEELKTNIQSDVDSTRTYFNLPPAADFV